MTNVRRRMRVEIRMRADAITAAHRGQFPDDATTAIALLVLGVEALEPHHSHDKLRAFFDSILDAPIALDPRADTSGT